jgi:hypothetical protein
MIRLGHTAKENENATEWVNSKSLYRLSKIIRCINGSVLALVLLSLRYTGK